MLHSAISTTACDGPAHMHAFFSGLLSSRLEARAQKSNRLGKFILWVLEPASALKAFAWTSTQATDCDLESRLRKSMSVWSLSLFLSSSVSLCLLLSLPLHSSSSSSSSSSHFMFSIFPISRLITPDLFRFIQFHAIFSVSLASNGPKNNEKKRAN